MEVAFQKIAEMCLIASLFLYHMAVVGGKLDKLTDEVKRRNDA